LPWAIKDQLLTTTWDIINKVTDICPKDIIDRDLTLFREIMGMVRTLLRDIKEMSSSRLMGKCILAKLFQHLLLRKLLMFISEKLKSEIQNV